MHISDGVLPASVTLGAWGVTGAATSIVIARIREDEIARTAVLTSLFLVASYISIPLPIGSVHLLLTGLMGILLGWSALPAIFVALFIQLLWFGYGGFYTLGVNTLNVSIGALAAGAVFHGGCRILRVGNGARARDPRREVWRTACLGFASGGVGVLAAGLCFFGSLRLAGEQFREAAKYAFVAHSPVLLIEALMTSAVVSFLARVSPSILQRRRHDQPS